MTDRQEDFQPACERCQSLCCVGLDFKPEYGFPVSKPRNVPCQHLDQAAFRCGIWSGLEDQGYVTCRSYDCAGAGQMVSAAMDRAGKRWAAMDMVERAAWLSDFAHLRMLRILLRALIFDHGEADHPFALALADICSGFERGVAVPALGELGEMARPHAELLLDLGRGFLRRKDPASAAFALERALHGSPEDPRIWSNLGIARGAMGDLGAGVSCLEKAVALAGSDPGYTANLERMRAQRDRLAGG